MIETAIKEDLFLDSKLIIPENRMDAIRIMNELHPVVGGQPTNEKNQPNDNNPILDLACTIFNIHESGIGVHADLRKIQNEPPKYFYGKGFMSGISSLKGNGILAVYGHWRDGSGRYAIKQFYYTDKEIVWRNAISDTAWSQWFDVLTGNSDLDYNKLFNVPITSTLSDSKTHIASIFAVNNVNRAAVNAQKTANTANANAVDAMNEANKKMNFGYLNLGALTINSTIIDDEKWMKLMTGERYFVSPDSTNLPRRNWYYLTVLSARNIDGGVDFILKEHATSKVYFGYTVISKNEVRLSEALTDENTREDSKGVLHLGNATPTDVLLVGDLNLGVDKLLTVNANEDFWLNLKTGERYFLNNGATGAPENGWFMLTVLSCRSTYKQFDLLLTSLSSKNIYHGFTDGQGGVSWAKINTSENTTTDPAGFLRSFGNAVALTTDKLTSDLKVNRSDLVASAKYAYDVYQAALAADKKAANAQITANTGVANAKTAQTRADAAFSRVKPIAEGGTGAMTAAQGRKNMGHGDASTRNVATSLESNGNTLVPAALSLGFGQKYKDVTAERAFGIPYKNNTQKPIYIMGAGRSNDYAAPITVDGLVVGRIGNGTSSYSFIVLPGSEYMFDKAGFANFSCIEVS